eukprot:6185900-Pleurochrysis_carterae.AAC.4
MCVRVCARVSARASRVCRPRLDGLCECGALLVVEARRDAGVAVARRPPHAVHPLNHVGRQLVLHHVRNLRTRTRRHSDARTHARTCTHTDEHDQTTWAGGGQAASAAFGRGRLHKRWRMALARAQAWAWACAWACMRACPRASHLRVHVSPCCRRASVRLRGGNTQTRFGFANVSICEFICADATPTETVRTCAHALTYASA